MNKNDQLVKFEFAKITCGQDIGSGTGYSTYCVGKTLEKILEQKYADLVKALGFENDEEKQFILHLEWDALRAGIAQYLGIEHESIDKDRCRITSVEYTETGVEIAEVILPPKEMPKILPCSLADRTE